jgi:phosphoglycerate dehydrogenase-like enzyme/glyoxylase-like metal-dependent hydrolase (beta-lactamase superfamily II)
MHSAHPLLVLAVLGVLVAVPWGRAADDLPKMKFNEVKEIAPGVFFRYSSISASDPKIPFGGSNHLWVVFQDYVVVIDANFPKEAGDVIADIKKTTKKPIRYVFDTHHHGDHAYGNAVWAKEGATIVAQANCARLLRIDGPKEFADAGKPPTGRKDIAESKLKVPSLIFDDKLVLDDGTQRVEFLYMGHAHTIGDGVAYLPKHKILCTGDACVNGRFNYMGHSDSASWVRSLEKMQQLDVKIVAPGHGELAGKDLLERQNRYFVELRAAVKKGLAEDKELPDIRKDFKPAWYKKWTGVDPDPDNVKHVYDELTGRLMPWELRDDFDVYAGTSAPKGSKGWTKPKRIVVPSGLMPARLAELKRIAPEVEFVPAKSGEDAVKSIEGADAVVGFATPELLKAGKNLRWVQVGPEGATKAALKELKGSKATLTDTRAARGRVGADEAFDKLLARRSKLRGKTMLVVGLGGAGRQIARRGAAAGMRVIALDDHPVDRPAFVFGLDKLSNLMERLPQANVVVLAQPIKDVERGLIGAAELKALKKSAYLVNISHLDLIDLPALAEALQGKQFAGAALATVDVGRLGVDHPLRKVENVTIHRPAPSAEARARQWRLLRENVRRFVAGEALLCEVEKATGE